MSLPLFLDNLKLLGRVHLQRLAKENSITANSKSTVMISSLARRYGLKVSADRIIYATSPETQATVDALLATVSALRSELTAAQLSIDELKVRLRRLQLIYITLPETQAIIDNLLVTVNVLRFELTAAQSPVNELKAMSTELMRLSTSVDGLKTPTPSVTPGPSQETSAVTATFRLLLRPVPRDLKNFDLTPARGQM
ncbi:hypothetical protein JCM1841_001811 [Sporobolomyces salmonicolor]